MGTCICRDSLVADNIGMAMLVTHLTADNVQFNSNDALASNDQTFAGNLSNGPGDGVAAFDGPEMLMREVVAWPDDISVLPLVLDHTCTPSPQFYVGIGEVILTEDPFAPSNLDFDGYTEFYLAPDSPCVDIGDVVVEYDWAALTTQASQCTDATPIDAGVHYPPLFDAGPC